MQTSAIAEPIGEHLITTWLVPFLLNLAILETIGHQCFVDSNPILVPHIAKFKQWLS